MDLILPEPLAEELRSRLLSSSVEHCAVLFVMAAQTPRRSRMLVSGVYWPESEDYAHSTETSAELTPHCVAKVSNLARQRGSGLVFVHTHPGIPGLPRFSLVDDAGEVVLREFVDRRNPGMPHVALVLGSGGMSARLLGQREPMRILEVGSDYKVTDPAYTDPGAENLALGEGASCERGTQPREADRFDRQVRAFGRAGQFALERLRVGVVGLGGTGSLVVQQLAHLGVSQYLLIDHDLLDLTNLNRVAGATQSDVKLPKVNVAKRLIESVLPHAHVEVHQGDITRLASATLLKDVDFLFGCTDSHGSRAVLQQVAYQYLIPCIDMGVAIATQSGQVRHVGGRVQLLAPGHGCLSCSNLLDPEAVRRDMLSEAQRRADPYFLGNGEPAPAVMPLNGVVTALAVSMYMSMVTGVPMGARQLLYDQARGRLRTAHTPGLATCPVCSPAGAYAAGDSWPLGVRSDA